MSSTRRALDSTELHQNRWASSAEFTQSINALLAAKRIREVADPQIQKLLWFIQYRSLEPRGLKVLAAELIEEFPERLGTPYTGAEIRSALDDAAARLPEHLARVCLNPEIQL